MLNLKLIYAKCLDKMFNNYVIYYLSNFLDKKNMGTKKFFKSLKV